MKPLPQISLIYLGNFFKLSFLSLIIICVSTYSSNAQCRCDIPAPPGKAALSPPCECDCPLIKSDNCDTWPSFESKISMTVGGYWRVIKSNGIPNHPIGKFPLIYSEDPSSLTYEERVEQCCCGRPTALSEQDYTFVMPAYSSLGRSRDNSIFDLPTPPYIGKPEVAFGVAVNGVPFDPAAAEWWNRADHEWALNPLRHNEMIYNLDCNNGHVQPDGGYHYHGFPQGLYEKILQEQTDSENNVVRNRSQIVLLGWAFDGNPIYAEECGENNSAVSTPRSSYRRKNFNRVRNTDGTHPDRPEVEFPVGFFVDDYVYREGRGDLDECNGHRAATPEFPDGIYHYHVQNQFPYIGRCYKLFKYLQGPDIFPKE